MGSFEQDRQHSHRQATPRDRVDRAPAAPDPLVSQIIALQQSVGNAAVSRLVARSGMLSRRRDGPSGVASPPAAPAPAAPAAPAAGGGQDALLAMTRVAWDTGVTQREKDAAAALHRPKARKADFQAAADQLAEARTATESIAGQFATLDPTRVTRAKVHANAIWGARLGIDTLLDKKTPADMGEIVEVAVVPSSESAIADITAPLPAGGASAGGAPPAAPAPAPDQSPPTGSP